MKQMINECIHKKIIAVVSNKEIVQWSRILTSLVERFSFHQVFNNIKNADGLRNKHVEPKVSKYIFIQKRPLFQVAMQYYENRVGKK